MEELRMRLGTLMGWREERWKKGGCSSCWADELLLLVVVLAWKSGRDDTRRSSLAFTTMIDVDVDVEQVRRWNQRRTPSNTVPPPIHQQYTTKLVFSIFVYLIILHSHLSATHSLLPPMFSATIYLLWVGPHVRLKTEKIGTALLSALLF